MIKKLGLSLLVLIALFVASAMTIVLADDDGDCNDRDGYKRIEVSGTGIHDFGTKLSHRYKETPKKIREISTETIDLSGDLEGRVLYQPKGITTKAEGKLVNTGYQVFSGTVKGSRPVMLFDDEYRFEVNFFTGEVRGKVYLSKSLSGPRMSCEIDIVNSNIPPADNKTFSNYSGVCWIRKN